MFKMNVKEYAFIDFLILFMCQSEYNVVLCEGTTGKVNSSECSIYAKSKSDVISNSKCLCPSGKKCFRKCCPPNTSKENPDDDVCAGTFNDNDVMTHPSANFLRVLNASSIDDVHVIYGMPCKKYWIFDEYFGRMNLTHDGVIHLTDEAYDNIANFTENYVTGFCTEHVASSNEIVTFICNYIEYGYYPQMNSTFEKVTFTINMVSYLTSILFLALSILVYASLPTLRQNNLHIKSLMHHMCALMFGWIFLFIIKCSNYDVIVLSRPACTATGYIFQYSFLASFFWLNVMCFDVWCTFRTGGFLCSRLGGSSKFFCYCLYAWGFPAIISAGTYAADNWWHVPHHMRPYIGLVHNCGFYPKNDSILYFLFSHISVIMSLNLLMFISTTISLKRLIVKRKKQFSKHDSRRHIGACQDNGTERLNLFAKLSLIMGINWMLEVVSYFLVNVPSLEVIFTITDIINGFQGLIIFLLFVCKKKTMKMFFATFETSLGLKLNIEKKRKGSSNLAGSFYTCYSSRSSNTNNQDTTNVAYQMEPSIYVIQFNELQPVADAS